jgi:hypothetical protein
MTAPLGTCHLCGAERRRLTFEHLPAKSAANDQPIAEYGLEHWLNRDPATGEMAEGLRQEEGAGAHTLCWNCQNETGNWYINDELYRWIQAGFSLFPQIPSGEDADRDAAPKGVHFGFKRRVRPLRFVKAAITMLFSVNPRPFAEAHPDLVSFVRDRERTGLPSRYRLYLVLYRPTGTYARRSALSAVLAPPRTEVVWLTELAWPPFAYVLTVDERGDPAFSAGDISQLANYGYDEWVEGLELILPVGVGHTPFPGDFRTRAALESAQEATMTGEAVPLPELRIEWRTGDSHEGVFLHARPQFQWTEGTLHDVVNALVAMVGVAEDRTFRVGVRLAEREGVWILVETGLGLARLKLTAPPLEAMKQFVAQRWPPAEAELFWLGKWGT